MPGCGGRFKAAEGFDAGVRVARNMMIVPVIVMPFLLLLTWLGVGRGYLTRTDRYWRWCDHRISDRGNRARGADPVALQGPEGCRDENGNGWVTLALDNFSINGVRFDWRFAPQGAAVRRYCISISKLPEGDGDRH